MPEKRKIIIDTDPGQDDAVAILLALGSPELDVVGITAVAGNVPLRLTEKNALKICELAGRPDIKVFSGAIRPLVRPLVTAEHVHGKTGLDGPDPGPVRELRRRPPAAAGVARPAMDRDHLGAGGLERLGQRDRARHVVEAADLDDRGDARSRRCLVVRVDGASPSFARERRRAREDGRIPNGRL